MANTASSESDSACVWASAIAGRVNQAIERAARLLEPKVQTVTLERSTLRDASEVEAWVDRQLCKATAQLRQSTLSRTGVLGERLERCEFVEQVDAVGDAARIGRLDEGERRNVAEAERCHLQDDRRQVGAQDLRLGERGSLREILLAVETNADARCHTAASARSLVGRRLRHSLDGESLYLQASAVARDARSAGVDHVAHARHGERRLGDVRAEHHAARTRRTEDAVLLHGRQSGVEGEHLERRVASAAQRIGRVVDLSFAAQEHEHVAAPLGAEFVDCVEHRLHLVDFQI